MLHYDDWSPASVFGSTRSPHQKSRKTALPGGINHNVSTSQGSLVGVASSTVVAAAPEASDEMVLREQSELIYQQTPLVLLHKSKSTKTCTRSNQIASPPSIQMDHQTRDERTGKAPTRPIINNNPPVSTTKYPPRCLPTATVTAVLLIQKHWRLAVLRRKETKSQKQVEHLRKAIQQIACEQIQIAWRKTQQYQRIQTYLAHRIQFEARLSILLLKASEQYRRLAGKRRLQRFAAVCIRKRRRHQQMESVRQHRAAECIRRHYSKWKTRLHNTQQRMLRRGMSVLLVQLLLHQQKIRLFYKWLQDTQEFLSRRDEIREYHAAKCVQRLFRSFLEEARGYKRELSAIKIQSVFRMVLARQLLVQLRRRRQKVLAAQTWRAAVTIQRIARGFVVRAKFKKLVERLKHRFQCANCGLIEPGGVYCKFCGRRRTTFGCLSSRIAPLDCEIVDLTMMSPSRSLAVSNSKQQPTARARTRLQQAISMGHHANTIPSDWVKANATCSDKQEYPQETNQGSAPRMTPPKALCGKRQAGSTRLPSKLPKPAVVLSPSIKQGKLALTTAAHVSPPRGDECSDLHQSESNQFRDVAEKTRARAAKLQISEWEREQRAQVTALSLHLDRLRRASHATKNP